ISPEPEVSRLSPSSLGQVDDLGVTREHCWWFFFGSALAWTCELWWTLRVCNRPKAHSLFLLWKAPASLKAVQGCAHPLPSLSHSLGNREASLIPSSRHPSSSPLLPTVSCYPPGPMASPGQDSHVHPPGQPVIPIRASMPCPESGRLGDFQTQVVLRKGQRPGNLGLHTPAPRETRTADAGPTQAENVVIFLPQGSSGGVYMSSPPWDLGPVKCGGSWMLSPHGGQAAREREEERESQLHVPLLHGPLSRETSIPSGRKMHDLGFTSGAPPPPWLELASVISRRPSGWVPGRASCFQPHEITWLHATRGQNQQLVSALDSPPAPLHTDLPSAVDCRCPYLEPLQAALIPSPGSPICGRGPAEPHGLQSLVLPAVRIAQASSTGTSGQFIPSVFPSHSRAVETTEAPGCWRTKQVLKHQLLAEPGVLSSPPKFNMYSQ
ncbi:hypothetical protein E2I00_017662, partial [Balaenoptera physalus]